MGWASGSELMLDVVEALQCVKKFKKRKKIYIKIVDAFIAHDWDTLSEVMGRDPALDAAFREHGYKVAPLVEGPEEDESKPDYEQLEKESTHLEKALLEAKTRNAELARMYKNVQQVAEKNSEELTQAREELGRLRQVTDRTKYVLADENAKLRKAVGLNEFAPITDVTLKTAEEYRQFLQVVGQRLGVKNFSSSLQLLNAIDQRLVELLHLEGSV